MKQDDLILIGHLQVLDESLVAIYKNKINDRFYMSIRTFDSNEYDILLIECTPSIVLDYMEKKIGLHTIINEYCTSSYVTNSHTCRKEILPVEINLIKKMIEQNAIPDMFDSRLSYHSWALKTYIKNLI